MSGGYKVLLLGASGVGKTSLMRMASLGIYQDVYKATIGCDFIKKSVQLPDIKDPIRLLIWDTAGTERYANVSSTFYRGADVVIFVYDVTDKNSYESLQYWEKRFQDIEQSTLIPYIVAANKCEKDVERVVTQEESLALCKSLNVDPENFFEVSAKEALNVELLFERAARIAYEAKPRLERKRSTGIKLTDNKDENGDSPKPKKKCACGGGSNES